MAIDLYDRLTGRNAAICDEFVDLNVHIPSGTGADAEHAKWAFNGAMKIRTCEAGHLSN